VRWNWFLRGDPQVQQSWGRADYARVVCPELFDAISANRDFTGIHPHFCKWDESRRLWFNEFRDADWAKKCLDMSVATHEQSFGSKPIAARMGDGWMSQNLVSLMSELGIRYDLTVEPGVARHPVYDDPNATDWIPDFRRAPREPWRPAKADFLQDSAEGSFWMIPVSTTEPSWTRLRAFPYLGKQSKTLNLVMHPELIAAHIVSELQSKAATPLTLVLRTGDLAEERFLRNFRFVMQALEGAHALRNCEFQRVDEACRRWIERSLSPRERGRE
jgi:hypothetical protein